MILEVVAYGSATMLDTVLNGVAMLANGGGSYNLAALAKVGMMASLIMVGFGAVFSQKLEVQKLLAGVMFFYMMFIPTTHVSIYDPYTGDSRLVANVPIGVGAPMSIITQTGRWMTEAFELAYWEPESKFEHGYLNSLQVLMRARDARAPMDVPLERSIQSYIETCVFYSMRDDFDATKITEEKLLNAPDIWAAMETQYVNRDAMIYLIDPVNGHPATCVNAYSYISNRLTDGTFRNDWDKYLKTLLGVNDESYGATAIDQVDSALNQLNLLAADAQTYMLNAFIGNLYKCETKQECSMLTQSQEQRRVQWSAEHSTFQQVARPMMAFTESLIPALAPIMALLATLSPVGVSMISKYFLTLMWIAMWQPLMALVNMYIAHAATNELGRFTSAGIDLQSYSGITNSWTTVADWISVGGMLAASVPVIAGTVVMGASMATGKMAGFAQGTAGTSEAASSATPALANVGSVHSQGAMQTSNQGVINDAGGTRLSGANATAAGSINDMTSQIASATSTRQASLSAATQQTETAKSAFMDAAANAISSESSSMRASTDSATWNRSNSTTKTTADRLAKQFGWDSKQSHEMALAAQMAAGLVSSGQLGQQEAGEVLNRVASQKGLRGQSMGSMTGRAGASGSSGEGLTSLLDSALAESSSTSSSRGGGVTDTNTTGTRAVASRIQQSQQAKDYSEAKTRQQAAQQQYAEAAAWSAGVSQQSNYDMPTLSGIIARTPGLAAGIESLASSTLTGSQLANAERGLRAAGIYGHNGTKNNIDQNLVRAKALADNGQAVPLLNLLRDAGVVRPNSGPTDMTPQENRHLASQTPGLSASQAGEVSQIANRGGEAALRGNQSRGAPAPAGSPAPAARPGHTPSQGVPIPSGSPGAAPPAGRSTPSLAPVSGSPISGSPGRESIDGFHHQFSQQHLDPDRAQYRSGAQDDRNSVLSHKPDSKVSEAGEQVVRSANTVAALDAAGRAGSIVADDIDKLSTGQKVALGMGVAAATVAPGLLSTISTAMSTKSGRQALGKALKGVVGKRAANYAAAGAVGATGAGAPVAVAMMVGSIALTAKDVHDVYQAMQQQGGKGATPNNS